MKMLLINDIFYKNAGSFLLRFGWLLMFITNTRHFKSQVALLSIIKQRAPFIRTQKKSKSLKTSKIIGDIDDKNIQCKIVVLDSK